MQKRVRRPSSRMSGEAGLSLIETLITLVIIGVVAAMIVPNVISRPDDARVTVAQADLRTISSALRMYRLDNRTYPSTAQGLDALVEKPTGTPAAPNWHAEGYLPDKPLDPWGNPYVYRAPDGGGTYELFSLGADGAPEGENYNADVFARVAGQ